MHLALVLALVVTAIDGPSSAPAAAAAQAARPAAPAVPAGTLAFPADPCAGAEALPVEPACGDVPLCATRDRVRAACELRDAMRARYVFLDAKPGLLGSGFDALARLDACVADERAIGREDEPLRFFDRIRACVGGFQDGHLIVTAPARLPQVALGVGLRRAGGKVVVAWRDAGLRGLVGDAAADALPLGAELVELDGVPVESAITALAREVPGSSAAARRARAVEALTRRDFLFPEGRTATLVVALAGGERRTVELPWWVSPGADHHPIAGSWVRRVHVTATDRLAWFDEAVRPRREA